MKKMLLLVLMLILTLSGSMFAQVIADFEDADYGTMGFIDGDWGTAISSIAQVADPSGRSDGVLEVNFDASGDKDPVMMDNLEMTGPAALLSYDLWLPADCPDSVLFKVFTQDGAAWLWQEYIFYAKDVPKEVWYPLYFDLKIATINGGDFSTKISRIGVEFQAYEVAEANKTWSGKFYMDDVKLIGAEPTMMADFSDPAMGTYGFIDGDWGTAISSIEQVDGALQVNYDAAGDKDPVMMDNVPGAAGMDAISYDIYLPADCPDSVLFKIFAQDGASWLWQDKIIYSQDIPKETWYPLVFSFAQMTAKGGDYSEKASRIGIEFQAYSVPAASKTWTGAILLDNIQFLGTETGTKWVLADYESEAAGPYFSVGGWGSENNGISTFERVADPTSNSEGVLLSTWNFIADSTNTKDAFSAAPVDLTTGATAISIDIFVPADFPGGINIEMWSQAHDWGWNSWAFPASDSTVVVPGQWSTMMVDLVENAEALKLAEGNPKNFGVQLGSVVDWAGDIYFDNYTVYGVEAPDAVLHTPVLSVSVTNATFTTGKEVQNSHLTWDDSDQPGLESFHIYMSENPITDLAADGVIKIGTNVPHGTGAWNHRPWTIDGGAKTYYYAIIAEQAGELTELNTEGTVGPVEFTATSIPAHATYDPNFSEAFTLDGMDTEFTENYKNYMMVPEQASGDSSAGWTLESTDVMFRNTFVIDDDYLYISADVTDDDPVLEQGVSQAWQGDALEFFIGVYDINQLSDYHTKGSSGAAGTGDHRISFTSYGTMELSGYIVTPSYPGVESVVYNKWGGDGYIIEARFALDSLAMGGAIDVVEGMMLPLRIDNTDRDMSHGDESRTLLAGWGGSSGSDGGNPENWLRPSCWGYLMVGEGEVAVDENTNVAGQFKLHENYPNPFNPTTNLKFELPKYTNVKLMIYDMLGNKIKTLVNDKRTAGVYEVDWNGTNDIGVSVASGMYFYKLVTPENVSTKKMMLIK